MRILLVEDEPAAARMLAKGLREQAYAVDVVISEVTVQEAGETTFTPSDMPALPVPCTQPETVSTETPSWKWQSQS